MPDQAPDNVRKTEALPDFPNEAMSGIRNTDDQTGGQTAAARQAGKHDDCRTPADLVTKLENLARLQQKALRAEWRRRFKSEPPERIHRDLLLLAIGWRLQERALGGLSAAVKRRLATAARSNGSSSSPDAICLKTGTRLVREWHGVVHEVAVLSDGFEWNGKRYRSLSKIAREITSAHWSGPRFFGLKPKPKAFGRNTDRVDD